MEVAELIEKMTKLGFEGASVTVYVDHRTGFIKAYVTAKDCGALGSNYNIAEFKETHLAIASAWINFKNTYKDRVKKP